MNASEHISLTPTAATHIRDNMAKQADAKGLRLSVKKTGCSGWAYVMDLSQSPEASDLEFESEGLKVWVDAQSFEILKGTRLDYVSDGLSSAFKFFNPNVKSACGCGESFNVDR